MNPKKKGRPHVAFPRTIESIEEIGARIVFLLYFHPSIFDSVLVSFRVYARLFHLVLTQLSSMRRFWRGSKTIKRRDVSLFRR